MNTGQKYDVTYVTIDSLSEGVGSSQIRPLISRLSDAGLKICLISFEKRMPSADLESHFESLGVDWKYKPFGSNGIVGGLSRFRELKKAIPESNLIHARSDIPAVSALSSKRAPVLWDVRSLWADQKKLIQKTLTNDVLYHAYRGMESVAASRSLGMSTLSSAVIPILEQRHKRLPSMRTVVSTAVDLDSFQLTCSLPPKFRALFSGTYNKYYDLHLSALFIRELNKYLDIETHWARPYESESKSLGVGESKVFSVTQFEMADLIPKYSFGVSICKLDAGPSLAAAMPTKLGEFLACGRPIVVNKGLGDMDTFIEDFNVGVVLDGSEENLSNSAIHFAELLSDRELPKRCRALAEKHFNMDIGAKNYLSLYRKMLESSNKK
jgi:glycosyltransferase involved in cell wall biosynthesis